MFETLINLIFGCKHPVRHHSALPFTHDGESYRVCLKCGAPIAFSVDDFEYVTSSYRRRKRREALRASRNSNHDLPHSNQYGTSR
jgi:hypothetical protein